MIRLASTDHLTSTWEPTVSILEQPGTTCCESLSSKQLTFLEQAKQSVSLYNRDQENAKEIWRQACASLDLTAEPDILQKTPLAFWQVYELAHCLGDKAFFLAILDKNLSRGMLLGARAVALDEEVVGPFVDNLMSEGTDHTPLELATATLFFHAHESISIQDTKLLSHIFRHMTSDEQLVEFAYELINFVWRNGTGPDDKLFRLMQRATQALCEQVSDEQWKTIMHRFIEDATNPKPSHGNPIWRLGPAMTTTKRAADTIKCFHMLDTNNVTVCNLVQSVIINAMRLDEIKAEELIQALANQGKLSYLLVSRIVHTNHIKVCLLVFKHLPPKDFKQFAPIIAELSRTSRLVMGGGHGGSSSKSETGEQTAKRYNLFVSLVESMPVSNFLVVLKVLDPSIDQAARLFRVLELYKGGFRGLWPNKSLTDKLYQLWLTQMQLGARHYTFMDAYKLACAMKLQNYDRGAGILANQTITSKYGENWQKNIDEPCMQKDPFLLGLAAVDKTYREGRKKELLELPVDKLVMVLPFMVSDLSGLLLLQLTEKHGLGIWQEALLYFLSPRQQAALDQYALEKIKEPSAKAYFERRKNHAKRLNLPLIEALQMA